MSEPAIFSLFSCAAAAAALAASLWTFLRGIRRERAATEQMHELRLHVAALAAKVDENTKGTAKVSRLRALLEPPPPDRPQPQSLAVVPARQTHAIDLEKRRQERAFALASDGEEIEEISKHTGMSPGEVRLLLKIRRLNPAPPSALGTSV